MVGTWLFNPFYYVAGGQALGLGMLVVFASGLMTVSSHSHFDGVLDFHTGLLAPFWVHMAEPLIAWLALAVVLFGMGLLVTRSRYRVIDVFGTLALARFPTLFIALAALLPGYQRMMPRLLAGDVIWSLDMLTFCAALLVVLVSIIWSVILMYRAYAISFNVAGVRGIVSFILGLLAAEIASKVFIVLMLMEAGLV